MGTKLRIGRGELWPGAELRVLALAAILVSLGACGGSADTASDQTEHSLDAIESTHEDEDDIPSASARRTALAAADVLTPSIALSEQLPVAEFNGGPLAHKEGSFAPVHPWPIIPLHLVQLPDGRVMSYGTEPGGKQGAGFNYAVWDTELGTDSLAFQVLPNFTATDIFCAGQTLLPSGQVMIVGGDAIVNGKRNYSNGDVNLFDPASNLLTKQTQAMAYKRWYATAVVMGNGEQLVLGGRSSRGFAGTKDIPATVAAYATTPEMRSVTGQWRTLSGAQSGVAYGALAMSWFYPRAWVAPDGGVFVLAHNGRMFNLGVGGSTGSLVELAGRADPGQHTLPSVMYAPGKILSVRKDRRVITVDIGATGAPVVAGAGQLTRDRHWGNATVLADGKVWVNGGSAEPNLMVNESYDSELWDPATRKWTPGATAKKPRLYHSSAMLLPDGTVFTGGGGAPGPTDQLNGEIYFPPYLFKRDGSGQFEARPRITAGPSELTWGQSFSITASSSIARATLIRTGAVTHSFNNDVRFFELPVTTVGKTVALTAPASPSVAPPGYYMLFAWNPWGVPTQAQMVRIR